MKLEELKQGAFISGIIPEKVVTIIDVSWHGSDVVEVVYKDSAGQLGQELIYRDKEPA